MSESFKTLRELVANQIEPRSWGKGTTTSAGTTETIVSTDFIMTGGNTRDLDGGWSYFTSGALLGQCRPIRVGGLDISTGTQTVANPYTASTPSAATFETHLRYPVKRCPGTPWVAGYLEMLNDAAARLWFPNDIAVSGVSGQAEYALSTLIATYPWLDDTDRILDVLDPEGNDGVRHSTGQVWTIHDDAESPVLVLNGGYRTGETFYLHVARPVWSRVKISGVWTDVTPSALNSGQLGLAADSDEIHVRRKDALALAITESMNHLGMKQPSLEKAEWESRRLYWAEVARQCKFRRLPKRGQRQVQAMKPVGLGGGLMGSRGHW